jgi:hypothetical protein
MYEQAWFVQFMQRFWPWLDASDEVEFTTLCIIWNFFSFFLLHHNKRLTKLQHQVVHLPTELFPYCFVFVICGDFDLFVTCNFTLIDVAYETISFGLH